MLILKHLKRGALYKGYTEIDRSSSFKKSMSGMNFDIIINGNSDFIISCNINKSSGGDRKH